MMLPLGVLLLWSCATAPPQGAADADAVRAVAQQYFDAQVREDADAILARWSASAEGRPTPSQLAELFESGDDQYSITIGAVSVEGATARTRVAVQRVRTTTVRAGGSAQTFRSEALTLLSFVREADGWKIASERSAVDEVVDAVVAAEAAERTRLMTDAANNVAPIRQGLTSRASRFAISQQYAAAQSLYEVVLEAARAAHDRRAESETLHNIGNTLYFQREFAKAGEYYQLRLALAREMKDEEAEAASTMGLATIAYTRGEYTPAIDAYRAALAMYERSGLTGAIGSTLIGIGNVQFLQAEYEAAAGTYRRALSLLQTASEPGGVNLARGGLARVFAARGDLGAALQIHQQILEEARGQRPGPGAGTDVGATLESIGELQYRLGNVDQARSAFDEARRVADARNDFLSAGRLFGDLGLTELVAGNFDAALADYVESRGRYEKGKSPDGAARAWVGIGFSHTALEKYTEAIAAYRTAIAALDAQQLDEESARAWLGLSMAQSGAGDFDAALESARRVRRAADNGLGRDLTWRAAVREGEVLRRLDRLPDAQQAFEQGIAAIQRLAADVATSAEARDDVSGSADAWAGLAFTLAQRGDAAAALVAEEQRRAHLRRLFLAPFERDIVPGSTAAERDQELQNARDLISVRAQLRAERTTRRPDQARIARLQEQIAGLVAARAAQQAALYERLPDVRLWRGLQPVPALPTLNEILAGLDALVIEYVVLDDELLILTAAHGDEGVDAASAIVPVKRRDVVDRVARAVQPAALQDAVEWRTRSAPLGEWLVKPVIARLTGRTRFVVVPDEVLWKIPFEALAAGDQDLARATVTYGPSLVTLAALRGTREPTSAVETRTDEQTADKPVLGAVAAPDVSTPLRAELAVTAPGWSPPEPAASIALSRRVASLYGSSATITSGADATEAAARALVGAADVLQMDVPFQMNGATPLFSSALLAGGDTVEAGRWELRKWFAERGRARILILPDGASFSAQGAGVGLDALVWAAAATGVSTVAIGRWPRDGYTTDALLLAWHERLSQSLRAPSDTFHDAAMTVRAKAGSAPSEWAGLRIIGGQR